MQLRDGSIKRYFIKLTETHIGKLMAQGEYEGSKLLYGFAPEIIPKPIAWGTFESAPELHWFMCDFVDIADERTPAKDKFCRALADLHKRSMGRSPNGSFGFHVITCNATTQQLNEWRTSWEEFYSDKLRYLLRRDIELRGPSPELDALLPDLFNKVIPRLLRPLETGGNTLSACAVHGDTWIGNLATQIKPDDPPLLFDPSAFWGHRGLSSLVLRQNTVSTTTDKLLEVDLKSMATRRKELILNRDWIREYFKNFPPDEPAEDWQDRSLLYNLNSALNDSNAFPRSPRYRTHVIAQIAELVRKFPEGYTGTCHRKGSPEALAEEMVRRDSMQKSDKESARQDAANVPDVGSETAA